MVVNCKDTENMIRLPRLNSCCPVRPCPTAALHSLTWRQHLEDPASLRGAGSTTVPCLLGEESASAASALTKSSSSYSNLGFGLVYFSVLALT